MFGSKSLGAIINRSCRARTLFKNRISERIFCVFWLLVGASTGLSITSSPSAFAQPADPELNWRTLSTEHFDIHYHEPLGWSARRVAAICEKLHKRLSPYYRVGLRERTQVVLNDETDAANGSATVLPYNIMRLYITAPEDMSVLSDYDDWLTGLIVHEYTHILQLDQTSGIPALLNKIFGKNFAPNQIAPRWFTEGIAVHEESHHTSAGRIRSTMFQMYLRMDALQNRLMRLDQISNIADRWPHGNAWYLYGGFFARFMADQRSGTASLTQYSAEYGDNLIPYGMNRDALRTMQRSFVDFYDGFLEHTRKQAIETRERVEREGRIEGERITWHGEELRSPRFVGGNHVIYFSQDNRERPVLRATTLPTKDRSAQDDARFNLCFKPIRVKDMVAPAVRWRTHTRCPQVVFSGIDVHRNLYLFRDLFALKEDRVLRLTAGQRAAEPDLHPIDANKVVFTVNGAGTTHLMTADLRNVEGTITRVVPSRRYEQFYTPRWSPDGKLLAVSTWNDGGFRDIEIIEFASKTRRKITHDRALDTGPAWSPDGQWLYFSSDRTGIANIYAYRLSDSKLYQVTNVLAGAYQPDISPDGQKLVYVGYTSWGFDLYWLALNSTRYRPAKDFVDTRPPSSEHNDVTTVISDRYEPLQTFYPRALSLELVQDAFGNQIGLLTSAADVIERHIASARLGIGLERGDVTGNISYTLRLSPLRLNLRGFRAVNPRYGYRPGGEEGYNTPSGWIEDVFGGSIGLDYTFSRRFDRFSFFINQSFTRSAPNDNLRINTDPNFPPPLLPKSVWTPGLSFGFQYSNTERYLYDISTHRGWSVGTSLGLVRPFVISERQGTAISWNASRYFPLTARMQSTWLRSRMTVLAFHYTGGVNLGDLKNRATFGIGGFASTPWSDAILNNVILGGTALRGYRPFDRFGDQYHLLQTELRFLIARLNRGFATLPAYLNRIYANVFVDCGDAFVGTFTFSNFRFGTGAELFFDFTAGYWMPYTLRLGLARGLNEGGQTQIYMHLGIPF